jgi:choline-glycine betaine transporter
MVLIEVQMVGRAYVQDKNTLCLTHTLVILLISLMVILMHKNFAKNTNYLQQISTHEIIYLCMLVVTSFLGFVLGLLKIWLM